MTKYSQIITLSVLFLFSSAFAEPKRVSVSTNAAQANSESSDPSVSTQGRYVAFESYASNLVAADTNGLIDVFVHDTALQKTERVSLSSAGMQTNHVSLHPLISADGRYVVFQSRAGNLALGATTDFFDIFIRDRELNITEQISVSTLGDQSNDHSHASAISADGRYVMFYSEASNLVEGDSNNARDVFIRDRQLKTTRRVSVSSGGEQGNSYSYSSSISASGRYLAFASDADNMVANDTNNQVDIFVHDQELGITERVSVSSQGDQANKTSTSHFISSDGRYIAFSSAANNLVENDTNGVPDIFLHDRDLGKTERVSLSSSGRQATAGSYSPSISEDGRFVAFTSQAGNLVAGDINGIADVFVRDLETKKTERITSAISGAQINAELQNSLISSDGRYVVFESRASNLVDADTNQRSDVFIAENPLVNPSNDLVKVEKLINNAVRESPATAAQLLAGTQYKQYYKVTNTSSSRIYQVKVFENGSLVCNFYALDPGQSRQRCNTFRPVLEGDQHAKVMVTAKDSVSAESLTSYTDAYYTGHVNAAAKLQLTHKINDNDANSPDQAVSLNSNQASVFFKIENVGEVELYRVKTYHDPVSPNNSGWAQQCNIGPIKPGQIRYCKRNIALVESGLNESMGRVQATNAIISATQVINAADPTYFIVP